MAEVWRYGGQAVVYLVLALILGYFSDRPGYTHFPPDMALIKLALVHGAARREPCRQLSPEELAELPANMRRAQKCTRERLPVLIELSLDGEVLYRASLPPTGLASDGPSRAYERFAVPPGRHELVARLRDSRREEGFDYEEHIEVELEPEQSLAIAFRAETGGFIFR